MLPPPMPAAINPTSSERNVPHAGPDCQSCWLLIWPCRLVRTVSLVKNEWNMPIALVDSHKSSGTPRNHVNRPCTTELYRRCADDKYAANIPPTKNAMNDVRIAQIAAPIEYRLSPAPPPAPAPGRTSP